MLRSLKDVNLPKFLAPDIPLFEGILSDLFPGVELPQADYSQLDAGLLANCERMSLQPTEVFIEKVSSGCKIRPALLHSPGSGYEFLAYSLMSSSFITISFSPSPGLSPRACLWLITHLLTAIHHQLFPILLSRPSQAHQLYEMILVRHGLMVVGYSYGAKTCIYK